MDKGRLHDILNSPSGFILVTGLTRTGKSIMLYPFLQHLNDGRHKINTLEDPIEYSIHAVRQSQVNSRMGVDFAQLPRGVLCQSPDVIMVVEIRDQEMPTTTVLTKNSGHFVLITFHALVGSAAIHTMLDMSLQPHLLASCLLEIIAQRLVRVLCLRCRVRYEFPKEMGSFDEIQDLLQFGEGETIFGTKGCTDYYEHDYSGRVGVFEIPRINTTIRTVIPQTATSVELQRYRCRTRDGRISS